MISSQQDCTPSDAPSIKESGRLVNSGTELSVEQGGDGDVRLVHRQHGRIGIVSVELVRTVPGDKGHLGGPVRIEVVPVEVGRAASEVGGGHGLESHAQAVLEGIEFQGGGEFFLISPTELVRLFNDVDNAFLFFPGPIKGDVGHGQLADFRLAACLMIHVEGQPEQAFAK